MLLLDCVKLYFLSFLFYLHKLVRIFLLVWNVKMCLQICTSVFAECFVLLVFYIVQYSISHQMQKWANVSVFKKKKNIILVPRYFHVRIMVTVPFP